MRRMLFALFALSFNVSLAPAFAQSGAKAEHTDNGGHSAHLEFEGSLVESHSHESAPAKSGPDRPSIGGHDASSGTRAPGSAIQTPGAPIQKPDPYPALTLANNAYRQAVAAWQLAYQRNQAAQAKFAKLVKEMQGSSAWNDIALGAAREEVGDAAYELSLAESARNAANSRAQQEFKAAASKFAEAQRAEQAESARQEATRESRIHQEMAKDHGSH